MPDARTLPARRTRAEAKAQTRATLLDSALRILDEVGEAGLTTTAVTKAAGLSQPAFYAHFRDRDDLLHQLIDQLAAERLRSLRAARQAAWARPGDVDGVGDIFRVSFVHAAAHPRLTRLTLRSRHDRSPLGDWSRAVHAQQRAALLDDLLAVARPDPSEADLRRVEMIAEGLVALTETMLLGHLDGRYPDVEEAVEVLVAFTSGYGGLLGGPAAALSRHRERGPAGRS